MFIKLLCVNETEFYNYYGDKFFTIKEGDIVRALIENDGIRFEYENNHYSPAYRFEDVSNNFISAFDEDTYNKVYQKVGDLTMHFEDGSSINLGDATIKHGLNTDLKKV